MYHAPCAGNINDPCTATYIGETERSMHIRLKEHHHKVTLPLSDEYASAKGQHARTTDHHEDITYLAREGNKMARRIKEAIYARALDPPPNRGGGLQHLLPHAYDSIISVTIQPPKPPPPSALGSPTPTFNINDSRPKGRPPGSRNRILCLPLVDAAIALAATPMTAPQATLPPPAAMCRPRKDTATAAARAPPCRRQCRPTSGATHPRDDNARPNPLCRCRSRPFSRPRNPGFLACSTILPLPVFGQKTLAKLS
jgi:hypothetical protein